MFTKSARVIATIAAAAILLSLAITCASHYTSKHEGPPISVTGIVPCPTEDSCVVTYSNGAWHVRSATIPAANVEIPAATEDSLTVDYRNGAWHFTR